jgi:transcription initiation factor TFIID TATA-box-binding protein
MAEQIQNVVSTSYLGRSIDLNLIAQNAINIQYDPKKFVAAIIRLRNPKTTTLLFNSGRLVCTGAKSIIANKMAARKVARIIQKIYKVQNNKPEIVFRNYIVQNIVGSYKQNHKIDLIALNYAYPKKSFYDPCTFPGIHFRPFSSEKHQ